MDDYIIFYICEVCGNDEYFEIDSLPGGDEFCNFCSECGGILVRSECGGILVRYGIDKR